MNKILISMTQYKMKRYNLWFHHNMQCLFKLNHFIKFLKFCFVIWYELIETIACKMIYLIKLCQEHVSNINIWFLSIFKLVKNQTGSK